ncbi:MAG: hypothetical protein DLM52_13410 [Chthoniobacterales bacterium]|nr:MAG: hypothetical protein DLM52_13410 [Chthoniobacterales bacterium]
MNDERPDFSKMTEREKMRYWVENWKRVGPELERIKRQELRALSDEEGTKRALRVMSARSRHACAAAKLRSSSGLVEQQRIFAKTRRAA